MPTFRGTESAESIIASDADDVAFGLGGDDTIWARGGNDRSYGGAGIDTLYGEDGNDLLDGEEGDDLLIGGAGNDRLNGGLGRDIMRTGAGIDRFDGGDGYDRISFFDATATRGVIADLQTGEILDDGFGNRETMISIEALGAGTIFADRYYGNADGNFFWIDSGDTVFGRDGDDQVQLGSVRDVQIDGGEGIDDLLCLLSTNRIDANGELEFINADRGVIVDLGRGRLTDGFGNTARVTSFETAQGTTLADRIAGSDDFNNLSGNDGDDRLFGLAGLDFLFGDDGEDVLDGGAGIDQLRGGMGSDLLRGGAGDDYMQGDGGLDRLFGGGGADTFVFRKGDTGTSRTTADYIADFSQTDASDDGTRSGDSISIVQENARSTFIGTAAFSGAIGEIRYFVSGRHTFVEAETDGIAGADIVIRLAGALELTASDFSL